MTGIFIASLGVPPRGYHEEEYSLHDRRARSRFAPAALAKLLDLRGWNAVVLVTAKARQAHYEAMADELASLGLQPRHAEISDSLQPDDLQSILQTVDQVVPADGQVVLDTTYGFRHLPMIHLVSLAYLVPFKKVTVEGIYYGAREAGGAFVDLSGLFDLIRWAHAIEAAREIGDLRLVAARLRDTVARQARAGRFDQAAKGAQTEAESFSRFVSAGLPIEIGLSASNLSDKIGRLSPDTAPPLVRRGLDLLSPLLELWRVPRDVRDKKDVVLDRKELMRQLHLVHWWIEKGDFPKALSVLREWIINATALAEGRAQNWLDYDATRKPIEDRLNRLSQSVREGKATDQDRQIASIWGRISSARNRAMHAGFAPDPADVSADKAREFLRACQDLLSGGGLHATAARAKATAAPLFANISNHPSDAWPPEQLDAARSYAPTIVDVPLDPVPPDADAAQVEEIARRVVDGRIPPETTHAMVMGEFTLTHYLVRLLQRRGVVCLAATTERNVRMTPAGEKASSFRFVRFREYPK